ncbi:ABC transporter substrate-binding protein [Nitratireductor pacificus]|uniref:ABC superfamily ATP binding cassette transporter substrate-binding protein n=1 Tax=Nitratireductor pacificus pht-3B TaxID=391937 RepID=K2MM60_9HYPH|nr:ABC transporter substrate-binding protein [Nitratireductor pacificus]EKF18317.1 ABC superfamily ATP binding cassette transporter substrate-binding protein [Nitratireductor pacificus pht-3B]
MKKTLRYLATAAGLAMLVAPAGAQQVTLAMPGDIRSIDFGVNRDGNTDNVLHHVVEALVAYRDDLSVGPQLAESWDVSEDRRSYTFTVRKGAVFHNGQPVTAADVKWSWERLLADETGFLCQKWFKGGSLGIDIQTIEALDERRVRFTLAEPNGLFLVRMAHKVCLTGIIHPDSVGPDGKLAQLIATGPFTMGRHEAGQFVELNRFTDYVPLDAPKDGYAGSRETFLDSVRFMVIADTAAAKTALLAGDIDILPRLDPNAIAEIEAAEGLGVKTVATPEWQVALIQNTDPLLKDRRIRQAISHAIDIKGLTAGATNGLGQPNPSAIAGASAFFGPFFQEGLGYDPEKAKALLGEAGYDGRAIKLITNGTYPFDNISAIAIQSMLQQVGITTELVVMDWASQYAAYKEGKFQMMVMGFSARTDPTLMFDVVVDSKENRANAIADDPELIETVKKSGVSGDEAERALEFKKAHQLMVQDASVIGLFNPARSVGVNDRVEGYEEWPLESPRLWGVRAGG